MRRNRIATILALLSLIAALAATTFLLVAPIYKGASTDPATQQQTATSATLIEVNGYRALVPLVILTLLAAAGLIGVAAQAKRMRKLIIWMPTSLLAIFVIIAAFSVGVFYLPATLLLVASAIAAK